MKKIETFLNDQSEVLRGILHIPEKTIIANQNDIVIFPNSGIMGAEGDYRNNYRIADYLERKGFYVFRFSPAGLGYSDGMIHDCKTRDFFGAIESGLFVGDISSAVRHLSGLMKFNSITLSGICGGAISAFLAIERISKVNFAIPIGMPVVLDSDKAQYEFRLSSRKAQLVLDTYKHKLFSPMAWLRLIMLKSDWKTILRALIYRYKSEITYVANDESGKNLRYSRYFHEAANRIFASQKKVLFIYGDSDTFWWEFDELFLNKYYSKRTDLPFEYYLLPNGNHMLSWVEMQMNVARKMSDWLESQLNYAKPKKQK